MLKQSVQRWNALRWANPQYIPDLSSADLEAVDLSGADLRRADLRGAYLSGAKLVHADLSGADLRRSHFANADLRHADLRGADLRGADLRGANLQETQFEGAVLSQTILDPACWTRPLLKLWGQAGDENRIHLIQALETKTALHGRWLDGDEASPEAILSGRGAESDDFTLAWDTFGITEEQVLRVLLAASGQAVADNASGSPRAMAAGQVGA